MLWLSIEEVSMNNLTERELQTHITILGWLYIVGHALFLLIALFAFFLLPTIGVVSGDPDATVVLGVIGTAVGVLMLVLGLPGVLAGYGLLTRKSWGRTLAMVIGVLGLVNFPIGTAIGVYALIVLLQQSATDYFEHRQPV
jgi:hypothetical protein